MKSDELTIVILAGGQATRFPGKLEATLNGAPLLAHVYRNLRGLSPTIVAGAGTFSRELDALLECPIVVDRWPGRGPVAALLSACLHVRTPRVFAVAGDTPRVDARVVEALMDAWQDGDEAVVPEHDGVIEPLAALYDRSALDREAWNILEGRASMHALIDGLQTRRVSLDAAYFTNVNTASDLAAEGAS